MFIISVYCMLCYVYVTADATTFSTFRRFFRHKVLENRTKERDLFYLLKGENESRGSDFVETKAEKWADWKSCWHAVSFAIKHESANIGHGQCSRCCISVLLIQFFICAIVVYRFLVCSFWLEIWFAKLIKICLPAWFYFFDFPINVPE